MRHEHEHITDGGTTTAGAIRIRMKTRIRNGIKSTRTSRRARGLRTEDFPWSQVRFREMEADAGGVGGGQ